MDLRYITAFISVASHLSFTKAANELNISVSAVSRQIKLLEQSTNRQLLVRTPQSVILTEDGLSLFRQASQFNNWVKEDFEQKKRPVIRIGCLQGVLEGWLTKILCEYQDIDKYQLELTIASPKELERRIKNNEIDFALNNFLIEDDLCSSTRLFKEEIAFVSNKNIHLKKLHQYTWILTNKNDYLVNYARKMKIPISDKIIIVDSINSACRLIANGNGIGMLPLHVAQEYNGIKITVDTTFKREFIYLTSLNYQKMPSALGQFRSLLIEKSNLIK